jgi:glycosyltransferase involved in cell wall biosynthesis
MLIENLSFPMDRRMRHEATALRDAGYQVKVICPRGQHQDGARFENFEGIRVYRYPSYQASASIGYPLEYGWALLCTFMLMLWLWAKEGFDYVHAANPPDLFWLLFCPFGWLGKKLIYDQHDLSPETYESKFRRREWLYRLLLMLERYSYRKASLVITTNESFYEIAQKRGGVSADRLAIVRSAPDLSYFRRTEPRPALKQGYPYMVAYLGVMNSQDGVDRVVRAAHHLQRIRGRKDVIFTLIGRGTCWEELRQLARSMKLDGTINFTGRVSDEDLLGYLSTADICVAPDPPIELNHHSTMNKIMEYMACGRPIVSFDLVESRRSAASAAVYVERDDPALLAEAIHSLLQDPERREALGEHGYERVRRELDWSHSAQKLVEAYSRLETNQGESCRPR